MTGAMYSAISGLKSHMNALNVIGNNIANVNTNAYKASRYTFLESLYTTSSSGSDGTTQVGGRNPAQLGYGASIGTIDLDMSTKNYTPTGYDTDVMIDGDGFFIVGDKGETFSTNEDLRNMYLTRLGNLGFDSQGYLVDGQGKVVYGFLSVPNPDYDDTDPKSPAYVPSSVLTEIRLPMASAGGVVDPVTGETIELGGAVYPSLVGGTPPTVVDAGVTGNEATDDPAELNGRVVADSIGIDPKSGAITCTTTDGETITVGYIALAKVENPNGVTHVDGHYYQALEGAGGINLTSVGGSVTNDAANPTDGLSGALNVLTAGTTKFITGGLESSGTDLATEITNMITVQRGYQANTRIVTVTDSMLEELVNMKR